jgi:hypothetical protein
MDVPQGARLLSIGEIFDRAISVLLRNFLTLTLAYGLIALPFRIFADWMQRTAQGRFNAAIAAVIANPNLLSQFFKLSQDPTRKPGLDDWGVILLEFVGLALASGLLAMVAARLLRGEPSDSLQLVPRALSRWFRILIVEVATAFVAACCVIATLIVWFLPATIYSMASGPNAVTDNEAAALLLAMLLSLAVLFCWLEAWAYCAFGAVAVDGVDVGQAMRTAWRLTSRKSLRLRSLAFGISAFSCYAVGVLTSLALFEFFAYSTHQAVIETAVRELVVLVFAVFVNISGIVFYLDAKARYAAIQDAAQNRENSAAR